MQPPYPQYPQPTQYGYPQSPRGRSSVWPVVMLAGCGCLVVAVVVGGAILFPVFAQAREKARTEVCRRGSLNAGVATFQYARDHDERFPTPAQWMDQISPYLPNENSLHCPTVSRDNPAAYGKAFNSDLAGKGIADIRAPAQNVMIFDSTNLSRNASDPGTSLPDPPRHAGKNVLVYTDGHAKPMPVTSLKPIL